MEEDGGPGAALSEKKGKRKGDQNQRSSGKDSKPGVILSKTKCYFDLLQRNR